MAGPEIRESVTVAGRAERARVARALVGGVLGPGHPCGDDAALLVSELFGNSARHSRSGAAGGTVTFAVRVGDGLVRVEVTDRSGPEVPKLHFRGTRCSYHLLAGVLTSAPGSRLFESRLCTCRGPVIDLACACRVLTPVTHRITTLRGAWSAGGSE
jgi:hypothetical protein